jgi:hypothetical protein
MFLYVYVKVGTKISRLLPKAESVEKAGEERVAEETGTKLQDYDVRRCIPLAIFMYSNKYGAYYLICNPTLFAICDIT